VFPVCEESLQPCVGRDKSKALRTVSLRSAMSSSDKTPTAARVFSALVSTPFRALKTSLGYGSTPVTAAAPANGQPTGGLIEMQCLQMSSGTALGGLGADCLFGNATGSPASSQAQQPQQQSAGAGEIAQQQETVNAHQQVRFLMLGCAMMMYSHTSSSSADAPTWVTQTQARTRS
jgi:hypothetical protein